MIFRESARRIPGEDFAARLARASALAAGSKFETEQPTPFIRLDFLSGLPDAYALGRTVEQMHSATAQVAKWMRNHASAPTINQADRNRVRLMPRAAGTSIFFDFPDTPSTSEMLPLGRTETLAEMAAFSLIERLPQSGEDDATLDALLSEPDAIKQAIDRLARAAVASDGFGLEISTRDRRGEHAVITFDQARVLSENLNLASHDVKVSDLRGTLDGMRTKRRLFYLITADESEISGAVDEELLDQVREQLGRQVQARIETTRIRTRRVAPERPIGSWP